MPVTLVDKMAKHLWVAAFNPKYALAYEILSKVLK